MNLPKEWESLVQEIEQGIMYPRTIVERCYQLHTKPPKMLTDAEIDEVRQGWIVSSMNAKEFARAIEAAVHKKQSEPETVTFRAARDKATGEPHMLNSRCDPANQDCEWLDADGKPQTIEVKAS